MNTYTLEGEIKLVTPSPRLILIPRETVDKWQGLMKMGKVDLAALELPKEECVYRLTIDFGDDMQADLKVCTSRDDVWSEMVWFRNGCEVSHTDVSDSLVGLWQYFDDPKYSVNVAVLEITSRNVEEKDENH